MDLPWTPNPFVPGHGQMPPFLAGREQEKNALIGLLAYLRAGRGAPRNAVLSGPRGNGKTALLRWLFETVQADGNIDAVWLTPSDIANLDDLATRLVPPSRFTSLRPDTFAFHVGIGKLGWELGERPSSLVPLLKARCERRPLLLALDECHALDPEIGQVLLNAAQVVCAEAPFLLVLAGTPDLPRHLNTMSATFWTRGEKLGIGRLDETAAAEALERPLAAEDPSITFEPSALADVVAETQCYPYFVQLWGAALWDAAKPAKKRIDHDVVVAAKPSVLPVQTAYYEDRFYELERGELLYVAAELGTAFAGKPNLERSELNDVIAHAMGPGEANTSDVLGCRDRLTDLGYVWSPPGAGDVWQPGIPSLMDYVREHRRPSDQAP